MTDNRNSEAAWAYHEATKHSYLSIRANPHFLNWANQPLPFKIYPTLERLRLPGEVRPSGIAALSAIAKSIPAETVAGPELGALAPLLYLFPALTPSRKDSAWEVFFLSPGRARARYAI